jgi:hypothetical protein
MHEALTHIEQTSIKLVSGRGVRFPVLPFEPFVEFVLKRGM